MEAILYECILIKMVASAVSASELCKLEPRTKSLTTSLMEGMVTGRVQYIQNKMKRHDDMQRKEVDFISLHISKKTDTTENIS